MTNWIVEETGKSTRDGFVIIKVYANGKLKYEGNAKHAEKLMHLDMVPGDTIQQPTIHGGLSNPQSYEDYVKLYREIYK